MKYIISIFVLLFLSLCSLHTIAQQPAAFPAKYPLYFNTDKWAVKNLDKRTDSLLFTRQGVKLYSAGGRGNITIGRSDIPVAEGYYKVDYKVACKTSGGFVGIWLYLLDASKKNIGSYTPGAKGVPNNCGDIIESPYSFVFYVPANTSAIDFNVGQRNASGYAEIKDIVITKLHADEGNALLVKQPFQVQYPQFDYRPPVVSKYPAKDKSLLFTAEENKLALDNMNRYPTTKPVVASIIETAEKWSKWNEDSLLMLIPDASVPRGFDLNAIGCPVHGSEIFSVGGTYPWGIDPKKPFKVTCPVGGETYPSNDFIQTVIKKSKAPTDSSYFDDGWGWLSPDNERFWFVAYANHWTLHRFIQPAILNLSRAYFLTKEKRYAHTAALLLHRLAEVYPSMSHANQSRYGSMQRNVGGIYDGKVVNAIWETSFVTGLAEAYDEIWQAIDGDIALQKKLKKSGLQIRSYIEANFVEDAIKAYYKGQVRGNFGMHQTSLLHLMLARQYADMPKMLTGILDSVSLDQNYMGARYALYNRVFRDGMPLESPGYNIGWVEKFAVLSYLLKKAGYDLYKDPKLKMLFDFPIKETVIGKYTPDWGDTGSPLGALAGNSLSIYQYIYPQYKDNTFLDWMAFNNQTGPNSFKSFNSLFLPALPYTKPLPGGRAVVPQPNRLFAGYGLGFLNNKADNVGLTFTYGKHYSHSHMDFLNFELFANNQKMMPDLGYPDAMNVYVKGIYTWSTHTVSHNTVMINARRQDRNLQGKLYDFSGSSFVQNMDASSGAYSTASLYRRNLVMVSTGDSSAYVVDIFRVKGGRQHDYLLHGPPGSTLTQNGVWSVPQPGTLAGENVPWGEIYDDKTLADPDYKGGYASYSGSGFQHLFNVQRLERGAVNILYNHIKDSTARLKIHILDNQPQQLFMADAYDKPRAKNFTLKYVVARRQGNTEDLSSTFLGVIEPFKNQALIDSVKKIALADTNAVLIAVYRGGIIDYILNDMSGKARQVLKDVQTDARYAVWSVDKSSGKIRRGFFSQGSFFTYKEKTERADTLAGEVIAIDPDNNTVDIRLPDGGTSTNWILKPIAAQVAFFSNDWHETVHPLSKVEKIGNNVLRVKLDDAMLIGRTPVSHVSGNVYRAAASLPFFEDYAGATLLDKNFKKAGLIRSANISSFTLVEGSGKVSAGEEPFWISNIGVGDRLVIKSVKEF